MKHLGLFAFGVTTCVLVPTALHLLEAGPKQVAKLVAPGAKSITLGTAKVDIGVDRSFVDPGDKVHVTLTATSAKHEKVTVAVLVYESTGSGGGRVETPPNRVGRDEVTLDIANGTAAKQLAFTLPGFRGQEMEGIAMFGHYTILVMPPAEADRLEKLRRRADRVENPMNDSSGKYEAFEIALRSVDREPLKEGEVDEDADKKLGKLGQIARLDVNTRPQGSPISILAPEAAHAGDELAITVRVKNPSKTPVDKVEVVLESRPLGIDNDYLGIDEQHVAIIDPTRTLSFAGRETKDVVFHVTATTHGTLGLFAHTTCTESNCYQVGSIADVALDAVDIAPADHPVVVVQ